MTQEPNEVGKEIREAMEDNPQDTPSLNIDPESNKPSIVGNPNNIPQHSGDYELTFMYPEEMVQEVEKSNMTFDEKTQHYCAKVKYTNKRVKPLYRGAIVVRLTRIFSDTGILKEDGYKKNLTDYALGQAFQNHIEDVAMLAKEVLGVPEDQIEYISPKSLVDFLATFLRNEPNIMNESSNFLA